jgi:hypothetical protein
MTYTFLFKNYLLAVCLHFSRSVKYSNNAIYRKVAVSLVYSTVVLLMGPLEGSDTSPHGVHS